MTVEEEERKLRFHQFSHYDAWCLGQKVVEIVQRDGLKNVAIRIVYDGVLVFQYLMDGKNEDIWVKRKENTVMDSGHSSMFVHENPDQFEAMKGDDSYLMYGGGFPIYVNDELHGAFCIGGLKPEEDHALAVKALKEIIK